jgi:predicted patatin/cPLA2 family phospholipase
MASGPRFYCIATSVTTREVRAFGDFSSDEELLLALRASCTVPVLGGSPIEIAGDRWVDGGVIESMPFATAFGLGATDALVLRSRDPGYRKDPYGRFELAVVGRREPGLLEAVRARPGRYNDEAGELERATAEGRPDLRQITPANSADRVAQLERDHARLAAGLRAGARAAARIFARTEVDLLLEPRPYAAG